MVVCGCVCSGVVVCAGCGCVWLCVVVCAGVCAAVWLCVQRCVVVCAAGCGCVCRGEPVMLGPQHFYLIDFFTVLLPLSVGFSFLYVENLVCSFSYNHLIDF